MSAYERWTWDRCKKQILSLKGHLGYNERLWILGFDLLESGEFYDPFLGKTVFDPVKAGPPASIPMNYNAIPEMYCLLVNYSAIMEIAFHGDFITPSFKLNNEECSSLLQYAEQNFETLKGNKNPFFGDQLDFGDLSFKIWPLPLIPMIFILHKGDEEIPHGCSILFDRSAKNYMPGLLNELAALTVWRLQNILDPTVNWGYCAK